MDARPASAPPTGSRDRGRFLLLLAVAAGLAHLFAMLAVALLRVGFPYELEWTEGSVLVQVEHVLRGNPIYAPPTPEYTPYLYTPLYFWLGAAASVLGGGFLPLRILSLVSILAGMVLAWRWVRRDTGSPASAWLTVGLFAAAFRPTGFWFDLARVDCLALFWVLLGLRALAAKPGASAGLGAAAAFTLAFLTKQPTAAVAVALLPYALLKGLRRDPDAAARRRFLAALLPGLAIGMAGASLLLDRIYGGWFSYYVFAMPSGHSSIPGAWWRFWTHDMLGCFPLPLALGAFAMARAFRQGGRFDESGWFLACGTAGMLGSAWISRTHVGSWDNVLLPAFAWLALLGGRAAAATLPWRSGRGAVLGILFLLQFLRLAYDPRGQIPTAADTAFGDDLVARIAAIPGDVWVPDHGHLALRAGKRPYGNRMPLEDVVRAGIQPVKADLLDSLSDVLRERRLAALLLDTPDWREANCLPESTGAWYALSDSLPLRGRAGFAKTGVKSLPLYLFRPLPAKAGDAGSDP